jgi:hypothetical protein
VPKGAHDVYPHPFSGEQTAPIALAGWQIDPHVPQLDKLMGVSQPLVLSPSQSRYPGLQAVYVHPPLLAEHTATLTWSGLHKTPQPPQLGRLTAVSHPLPGLPSHCYGARAFESCRDALAHGEILWDHPKAAKHDRLKTGQRS